MDGLRVGVTCSICREVYQRAVKEPLTLPCGHTFCRPCLIHVEASEQIIPLLAPAASSVADSVPRSYYDVSSYDPVDVEGIFLCPTCKRDINVQVKQLSVNHSILNMASSYSSTEPDSCSDHGDALRYWCCNCECQLCSLCLYSGHPQGHTVQLANIYIQDKKTHLQTDIKLMSTKMEGQLEVVRRRFMRQVDGLGDLCKSSDTVHHAHCHLSQLHQQVMSAPTIAIIKEVGKKVEEFKPTVEELTSGVTSIKGCTTTVKNETEPSSGESVVPDNNENGSKNESATLPQTLEKTSDRLVRTSRLEYKNEQLLMHGFSLHSDARIYLQAPCEVFLELGVRGQCLGQVNIRLWCHLRRAQQFMALCMGTLGSSIRGAKATEMFTQNQLAESLVFPHYIDASTNLSKKPLLTDLEQESSYAKPITEGLVMQCSKRYMASRGTCKDYKDLNYHTLVICTKDDASKNAECPFGEVVRGLEVVKASVTHHPVSEVMITECGIVLPPISKYLA